MRNQALQILVVQRLLYAAGAANQVVMGRRTGYFVDRFAIDLRGSYQLQIMEKMQGAVHRGAVNGR